VPLIDMPLDQLKWAAHGLTVAALDEVCPPTSQFAARNRMTCAESLVIHPDFAHENLPGSMTSCTNT
jgi:cephalosporin-C deacetylase-like acetyl esterase